MISLVKETNIEYYAYLLLKKKYYTYLKTCELSIQIVLHK